jgi:hypothetical protein
LNIGRNLGTPGGFLKASTGMREYMGRMTGEALAEQRKNRANELRSEQLAQKHDGDLEGLLRTADDNAEEVRGLQTDLSKAKQVYKEKFDEKENEVRKVLEGQVSFDKARDRAGEMLSNSDKHVKQEMMTLVNRKYDPREDEEDEVEMPSVRTQTSSMLIFADMELANSAMMSGELKRTKGGNDYLPHKPPDEGGPIINVNVQRLRELSTTFEIPVKSQTEWSTTKPPRTRDGGTSTDADMLEAMGVTTTASGDDGDGAPADLRAALLTLSGKGAQFNPVLADPVKDRHDAPLAVSIDDVHERYAEHIHYRAYPSLGSVFAGPWVCEDCFFYRTTREAGGTRAPSPSVLPTHVSRVCVCSGRHRWRQGSDRV